ncbi:Heat Shock Transcription Factor, X-Linked Member 3 [Manis pentadactyla]|nr:Heat Shock Transcription Factor, X-Linked Member 3 [Manis pentadactyla]
MEEVVAPTQAAQGQFRQWRATNRRQGLTGDPVPGRWDTVEQHGDQALGPHPGTTSMGDIKDILRLPLPRKLWLIVQDDAFTSVHWNDHGDAVIIEQDLFQREIPHRSGSDRIFETDSLTTSIRQKNLYGFSKIRPDDPCACSPGNKRMMVK